MIRMVDIRMTSMCTAGLFVYIVMVSASHLPGVKLDDWPSSSKVMALYDQKIQALPENVFVTSLVECYEMVLAIIMSVPENVWDEFYRTCFRYLHKCYWGY